MTRDDFVNPRDLAIVEKYEAAVNYLYPILQSFPRRHASLRDRMVGLLFDQVGLLYEAAKSRQVSRLYAADAHMATLRFWLRFAADPKFKAISPRHLAETGALWQLIDAKISCRATLRLIESILPRSGIGIPIGSLTSQIFANIYGGVVDRHLQQSLGERHWYRYMDDIVVLGSSADHLRRVRSSIEDLSRDRLGLRFSKWSIQPVGRGVNFVGYRIWPTHKLLRRDSVTRAKRKIRFYRASGDFRRLDKFLAAWTGHAGWADSRNLIKSLGLPDPQKRGSAEISKTDKPARMTHHG